MTDREMVGSAAMDATVDAALAKGMVSPALPTQFRERLRAALARAVDTESMDLQRARLEREHCAQLAELRHGYLRLRRRTLATLIGGTIAIGAGVWLFLPWLIDTFGNYTTAVVSVFGGVVGLSMGASASRIRGMATSLD